jgi:uncharacterized Zn finger protein (UPF0148 family)
LTIECPNCKSTKVYKHPNGERICGICGYSWKEKKESKNNNQNVYSSLKEDE